MSSITLVEKYPQNKKSSIAIRPYFESNRGNMGLEKYGLSLFDGAFHEEQLACLEVNGIKRYLTGLNEFAPEIKVLPTDQREAKVREIRTAVAELERELAANVIDIEDKDFWNKVKLLSPNNKDFWNKIDIKCGNEPVYLDPKDPFDRIKLYAIEAGGFSIISRSYDEARSKPVPPKFYLDKEEETVMAEARKAARSALKTVNETVTLRNQLDETQLLTARSLYLNKLFVRDDLSGHKNAKSLNTSIVLAPLQKQKKSMVVLQKSSTQLKIMDL